MLLLLFLLSHTLGLVQNIHTQANKYAPYIHRHVHNETGKKSSRQEVPRGPNRSRPPRPSRRRVITTIKINYGNYLEAYLVQRQVAENSPQLPASEPHLTFTGVCVRPIGTLGHKVLWPALDSNGFNRARSTESTEEDYVCVFCCFVLLFFAFDSSCFAFVFIYFFLARKHKNVFLCWRGSGVSVLLCRL